MLNPNHLFTDLKKPKTDFQLALNDSVLSLGSCFAHLMGGKLSQLGHAVSLNPSGIVFNPLSLFDQLEGALNNDLEKALFFKSRTGHYASFLRHSCIVAETEMELVSTIESINKQTKQAIENAQVLILTFGTAQVFEVDGRVVASCHKENQGLFSKRLLEPEEIVEAGRMIFEKIVNINPKISVILSVSPIRHTKMGLVDNNVSKAVLLLSAKKLAELHANTYYFPAFEIMLDVLRDYRFYKSDLIHPNEMAENIVWNYFQGWYCPQSLQTIYRLKTQLLTMKNHNMRQKNALEHKKLKQAMAKKQAEIESAEQKLNK